MRCLSSDMVLTSKIAQEHLMTLRQRSQNPLTTFRMRERERKLRSAAPCTLGSGPGPPALPGLPPHGFLPVHLCGVRCARQRLARVPRGREGSARYPCHMLESHTHMGTTDQRPRLRQITCFLGYRVSTWLLHA